MAAWRPAVTPVPSQTPTTLLMAEMMFGAACSRNAPASVSGSLASSTGAVFAAPALARLMTSRIVLTTSPRMFAA